MALPLDAQYSIRGALSVTSVQEICRSRGYRARSHEAQMLSSRRLSERRSSAKPRSR
jgi:hypothetical protein